MAAGGRVLAAMVLAAAAADAARNSLARVGEGEHSVGALNAPRSRPHGQGTLSDVIVQNYEGKRNKVLD